MTTPVPAHSLQTARRRPGLPGCLLVPFLVLLSGCSFLRPGVSRPGNTHLASPIVTLPFRNYGNLVVVETQWDRSGPYHFLIDTGSSVTLVSPEFSDRYRRNTNAPPSTPEVRVRSITGDTTILEAVSVERIELGAARFYEVPALIYDCTALSANLGVTIDGVLGFPLFRQVLLTLDYPNSQIVLARVDSASSLAAGSVVPFQSRDGRPLIPLQLGDRTLTALIDSGSDAVINLNPLALDLTYGVSPRPGGIVSTLTGEAPITVGRIAGRLQLGSYPLEDPIVRLSDNLTAIGGGLLRSFSVTLDQERNQATFYRDTARPLRFPPRISSGLAFTKTPAYWRVESVLPDSPAAAQGVRVGDLITRIDGEPVAQWDLIRFNALVESATQITFTFLNGASENSRTLNTYALVP